MRKLIESTHVSLGGDIGSPQDWASPYLDDEHMRYATALLAEADALLLGRRTFKAPFTGYTAMASDPFVDRMNSIPKYVASRTLTEATWHAAVIAPGDVADFVADLKRQPGETIVKYGNGLLDQVLMANNLVDRLHLLLTPVAAGWAGPAPVRGDPRRSAPIAGGRSGASPVAFWSWFTRLSGEKSERRLHRCLSAAAIWTGEQAVQELGECALGVGERGRSGSRRGRSSGPPRWQRPARCERTHPRDVARCVPCRRHT